MSDQSPGTPGTPQDPPAVPPAAPVDPAAPAAPPAAAPAPAPAAPPPAAAQPPVPPPAAPAAPAAAPAYPPQAAAPVVPPPAPTTYAAPPGAPGGPGYGATQGAPPPAGGYFKSGKNKTIALIVGGVVAVGVIGGVAALLAGGGDSNDEVTTTAAAPQGSGVLDPAPVENTDPAPAPSETTEPAPETSAPAPETSAPAPETSAPAPAPAPDPQPAPSGDSVVIGGNISVPVLSGWQVFGSDDSAVAMGSGNDFVYAVTGTVKPSTDAGQLLSKELKTVLPGEQYPDLRTSDVTPVQAGGSIVSLALLEYEATWTDGQGTVPVHGVVFSAVRQDGTALIILGEHSPPGEFADIYEQALAPTIGGALNSMAGVS